MKIKLNTEQAEIELETGSVILTEEKFNLKQNVFLVVSNIDDVFPYTLINLKENKVVDSYKNIDSLINCINIKHKILEIIPPKNLVLKRIL